MDPIPAELRATPRPTPIWAPGVGYLITTGLLAGLFLVGPGVVAILLGVKVDAPAAMRAGAVAVGAALIIGYVFAMAAIVVRRRIYREGPLERATIIARTEIRNRAGHVGFRYQFVFSAGGREIRRSRSLDNLAIRAIGFEPQVKDVAYVAHDAARPRRCFLWGFERADGRRWIPGQR